MKLFLLPSRLTFWIALSLVVTCLLMSMVVLVLHFKEKVTRLQKKIEKFALMYFSSSFFFCLFDMIIFSMKISKKRDGPSICLHIMPCEREKNYFIFLAVSHFSVKEQVELDI